MGDDEQIASTLRVFEIEGVDVELPCVSARRHEHVFVGFDDDDKLLGRHARIVGDDGVVILNFPWYDHADRALGGVSRFWYAPWRALSTDEFPTTVPEEGWDDLEQGWWGQIIPAGDDLFIAETDFDEILDRNDGSGILEAQPGFLFVNGVLVTWNVVTRSQYEQAWRAAIDSCRRGRPSPVGARTNLPIRNPRTGETSLACAFSVRGR